MENYGGDDACTEEWSLVFDPVGEIEERVKGTVESMEKGYNAGLATCLEMVPGHVIA